MNNHNIYRREVENSYNKALLNNYLLNLIAISTDILQNLDNYEIEKAANVGELVAQLAEFRKNNMIELPF